MQVYKKSGLLLLALLLLVSSLNGVFAREKDKDKDKSPKSSSSAASKTQAGECAAEGSASGTLDANNIAAKVFTNSNLFYNGDWFYEVPKGSGSHSIFAASLWVGGYVDGQLRTAAATYENYEFRPGPLDASGNGPTNCAQYDRIWKITRDDINNLNQTGRIAKDIDEWPWQLGAPVVDGDGNPNNYNVAGGDRPQLIGDQTLWWVMNDVAAPHKETNTAPIGLEIQMTAFAFNQPGALGNTTFYKAKLRYQPKDNKPMTDSYVGIWADIDLGNSGDDRVGSDTTLGMGFTYNADNDDEGSGGYGNKPPAIGFDFFQGPLVDAPGEAWMDPDSTVYLNKTRLGMSRFVYYNNENNVFNGNPVGAEQYYSYLNGFWLDGRPITEGGAGAGGTKPVKYMWPAMPPNYWSEENIDNKGGVYGAGDRRLIQSTGPFTMNPGDVQEIVFGIVWSQASGGASVRMESLKKLKIDDQAAQAAFNSNFKVPPPPDAPVVEATALDQKVILTWSYPRTSNNYLGSYDEFHPDLAGYEDKTYTFEGFNVYQYESPLDQTGRVVATYDIKNGVTRIVQPDGDLVRVAVEGTDSGIRWSHEFRNLTNYKDYYFGVEAYAYNANGTSRTYPSPITRVTVTPSREIARNGGTDIKDEALGQEVEATTNKTSQANITARVIDPGKLTGETYKVEFRDVQFEGETFTVYDIFRGSEKIFDGELFLQNKKFAPPLGENVFAADGLTFDIQGPAAGPLTYGTGIHAFVEVAGPTDQYGCGAKAGSTGGCAQVGGNLVYSDQASYLSVNGNNSYMMTFIGPAGPEQSIGAYSPHDFEIRFTEKGSYAYDPFETGNVLWVPYEIWDIGRTGTFNQNNPNDDVQLVSWILPDSGAEGACAFGAGEIDSVLTVSHAYDLWSATDRIYAYYPKTSYADFEAKAKPLVDAAPDRCYLYETDEGALFSELDEMVDIDRGRPIQRMVFLMNPASGLSHPATGVVIRFYTNKPAAAGENWTFNSADFAKVVNSDSLAIAGLEQIGVVPNPYRGASAYETTRIVDQVRFTNMPDRATIRIFTLNGTLIRTIEKDSPGVNYITWDLQTENNLPIASGMYLIHVEVPNVGEKIIKFGVVKKRIQLNEL